ncbi:hypothetical protein PT974_01511, partial [Cladobotryum mycophilum]
MSKHYANGFHAKVPPSKPMMKGGIPRIPRPNLPPGTAPTEGSFHPNPIHETPGQALNPDADEYGRTEALDFPGATSADVYGDVYAASMGGPLQGLEGRDGGKKFTGE